MPNTISEVKEVRIACVKRFLVGLVTSHEGILFQPWGSLRDR